MSRTTSHVDNLADIRLPEDVLDEIRDVADERGMSVAELILDLMDAYLAGRAARARKRGSKRFTMWIPNDRKKTHRDFSAKVKRDGTTLAGAVEAALREMRD